MISATTALSPALRSGPAWRSATSRPEPGGTVPRREAKHAPRNGRWRAFRTHHANDRAIGSRATSENEQLSSFAGASSIMIAPEEEAIQAIRSSYFLIMYVTFLKVERQSNDSDIPGAARRGGRSKRKSRWGRYWAEPHDDRLWEGADPFHAPRKYRSRECSKGIVR
jgi:hypothetical protein